MAGEESFNETAQQETDFSDGFSSSDQNCNAQRNLNGKNPVASPEQMVALATSLAIAMTNDKTLREIETMVTFVQSLKCALNSILDQRAINLKQDIEIIIP